jgi:hypothetical protein
MKKNVQRQEGLKLVYRSEIEEKDIQELKKEKYRLIQEFKDDPYLINGRKINLRMYTLFVCDNAGYIDGDKPKKAAYFHQNGFVYYTPAEYEYGTNHSHTITTGYVPRELYDTHPLTHSDLVRYMGEENAAIMFENIYANGAQVMDAIQHVLCREKKGMVDFQLFGVDYQISEDLSVYMLEINKGPSLTEFDKRDALVKHKVQMDVLSKVKAIEGAGPNEFTRIWYRTYDSAPADKGVSNFTYYVSPAKVVDNKLRKRK